MTRRRDDAQAFNDAWEGGSPTTGEIEALVRAAELLCASADVQPSQTFRTGLREQLMTEARTSLEVRPVARQSPRGRGATAPARRRVGAAVTAVVASVGAVSLVTGSAQATPGEMLYPVKRGVENVQLSLKGDGPDQGSYQLHRAAERLHEAKVLAADPDRRERLPEVLDEFSDQARDGSSTMFGVFDDDGDERSIREVTTFATDATTTLTDMVSPDLTPAQVAAWEDAARTVADLGMESARLCASCARADIEDLVRAVSDEVEATTPDSAPSEESVTDRDRDADSRGDGSAGTTRRSPSVPDAQQPAPPATTRPAPSAAAPAPSASAPPNAPSPAPTTRKPVLREITDPLLGGLLGDETQPGLLPGLLGRSGPTSPQ